MSNRPMFERRHYEAVAHDMKNALTNLQKLDAESVEVFKLFFKLRVEAVENKISEEAT